MQIWTVLAAAAALAAAVYVQYRLPAFTVRHAHVWVTRAILALVGIGFGLTAAVHAGDAADRFLAFVTGFGLVHMPAAVILLLKRQRGEGRS